MCVLAVQSCLTLCIPMDCSPLDFSRPGYWSGLPFPSPGDRPNPGTEPMSPALRADSLLPEPPGKLEYRCILQESEALLSKKGTISSPGKY